MNLSAGIEKSIAGRWIAGYYPEDAISRTKLLNSKGISTMINFLGEDTRETNKIKDAVDTYLWLIKRIESSRLNASISVKPTQLGVCISYNRFYSNYLRILKQAKTADITVWFDMESPENIDATIKAYRSSMRYGNNGICIQSYLRRSMNDVQNLLEYNPRIRLVKGAYTVSSDLCFKSSREINSSYLQIMRLLFRRTRRFMIATHDSRIIEQAIRLNKTYKKEITFAMLNGIRNKYAMHLVRSGQKVSIYVPFGSDWLGYGLRRLTEQRHISLIVRSLLESQELI